MPTNTYVALDKKTLTSDSASIEFTSIPQGYTDLIVVINAKANSAQDPKIRFNGDSSSLYSGTGLFGSGSSASSGRTSGTSGPLSEGVVLSTSDFSLNCIAHVMNYSNTTTYKTWLSRINNANSGTAAVVGLYRSTSAITSVTILVGSGTMSTGSTFSLYGIAAASVGAKATGGTIYSDSQYYYHVFGSTGTFTPTQSLATEMLVVGGGGGGSGGTNGVNYGSAGAASIVSYSSQTMSNATAYTCTVGGGGAGATGAGSNGTNSSISGSGITTVTATAGNGAGTGRTGGSNATYSGGTASASFDGGGGAGSTQNGSLIQGGNGTNSYSAWFTATGLGVNGYIAGGGSGGGFSPGVAGGLGGGGNGRPITSSGVTNTGSGGGGNDSANAGGSGGSGLVIVRYAK